MRPTDHTARPLPPAARIRRAAAVLVCAAALLALAASASGAQGPTVATTEVRGPITPVVAEHLADTVQAARDGGHVALVVELDTPGGLVTSMREIVQTFLGAPLPVVVYVSPRGSDAGSAGTFITLSAHIAAMAPATTIGAATPVDLEGGEVGDKVVNNAAAYAEAIAEARGRDVEFAVDSVREGRSVTADEALRIGAVDLIADDLGALLDDIDGRAVELAGGTRVTLDTAGATPVELEMSWTRRLLQALADPNLAFLFISIGTLAIIYEVANPGVGLGGIVGALMLIMAFVALSVLPVNLAGAALLVLAAGLFVAEAFVPGVGVLAAGGALALLLGGLLLFQRPTGIGVDLIVLVPTVVVSGGLATVIVTTAARTRGLPSRAGSDALIGRHTTVRSARGSSGRAMLDGTSWRIRLEGEGALSPGSSVRVVDRDGLDLIVRPEEHASNTPDPSSD